MPGQPSLPMSDPMSDASRHMGNCASASPPLNFLYLHATGTTASASYDNPACVDPGGTRGNLNPGINSKRGKPTTQVIRALRLWRPQTRLQCPYASTAHQVQQPKDTSWAPYLFLLFLLFSSVTPR